MYIYQILKSQRPSTLIEMIPKTIETNPKISRPDKKCILTPSRPSPAGQTRDMKTIDLP